MNWTDRVGRAITGQGPGSARTQPKPSSETGRRGGDGRIELVKTGRLSHAMKARPVLKTAPLQLRRIADPVLGRVVHAGFFDPLIAVVNTPVPPPAAPVRTEDALLYPNPDSGVALYAANQPAGTRATVMIRTELTEGTTRTVGGSATIAVSGLPLLSPVEIERRRQAWQDALAAAGAGTRTWRFSPLNVRSMTARLQLPSDHAASAPQASADPDTVSALFLAELTVDGAKAWRQALEGNQPAALIGTLSLELNFTVQSEGRISTQTQTLSAPLGLVVAAADREYRLTQAEVAVEAQLVVAGHPSVERTTVELRAPNGVETAILDSGGGALGMTIATSDTEVPVLSWEAEVCFAPPSWPVVSTGGTLSQAEGWIDTLKPSAWIRTVEVVALLLNDAGELTAESEPDTRITGSVDLTAGFLANRQLRTSFEAAHQGMVSVNLPSPPGVEPGTLGLTVMALRGVHHGMATRVVQADEYWLIVKVYPDCRIQFASNATAVTESMRPDSLEAQLERLVGGVPTGERL